MRYPSYPSYKPSGVEWLGDVPEHWDAKWLKWTATYRVSNVDKVPAENEVPVRLCNYTDVYYRDFISSETELMETTATTDEIRRFRLLKGDVVITKDSESWDDIAVPAYVRGSIPDLVCGYHLAFIRPDPIFLSGAYLFRCLQAEGINDQFQVAASGVTRFGLPKASIGTAWIPMPPVPEQEAIASFLDSRTAKIDTLIEKKHALIEKLKEKRVALISRTVTRGLPPEAARAVGLNPHPKLKTSGIEWLGDVPENWEMKRLNRIATISYGIGGEIDRSLESGLKTVSLPNIDIEGRLNLDDVPFAEVSEIEKRMVLLQKGDLLFNWRNGSSDHLAKTAFFDSEGEYSHVSFLLRLRFNPTDSWSAFYHYLLNGYRITGFFKHSKAGVNNTFNLTELSALPVICPPVEEQHVIADYLERETAKIDRMIEKVNAAIEKLREYRTALITAAVMGKIDVRHAA